MFCPYGTRCQFVHSGDKDVEEHNPNKRAVKAPVQAAQPETPETKPRINHERTLKRVTRQLELKLEEIQEIEEVPEPSTASEADAAEISFDLDREEKLVAEALDILKLP